jgi:hypothetical protein
VAGLHAQESDVTFCGDRSIMPPRDCPPAPAWRTEIERDRKELLRLAEQGVEV